MQPVPVAVVCSLSFHSFSLSLFFLSFFILVALTSETCALSENVSCESSGLVLVAFFWLELLLLLGLITAMQWLLVFIHIVNLRHQLITLRPASLSGGQEMGRDNRDLWRRGDINCFSPL